MNNQMVNKIKDYCLNLLTHSRCKVLPFHSVKHTLEVFENVAIIGSYEDVSEEEIEILKIAGLFHDTGISKEYDSHEKISANYAHAYLSSINYSNKAKAEVMNCINATKMPQSPESTLECIMCDADLLHLSSNNYLFKSELLRMEWKEYMGLVFTDQEWYQLNLDFLKNHNYHTNYGKNVLQIKKENNIMLMKRLKAEAMV
ncbi:HD domain-containing protein [Algibacter miyuki]|uniref:HD domain-containing protein n=1 Tax=Algibacter miyuki TaxID=1306933 RepID=A0ABV5H4E3_9FLAO|nr:HD domain-containing protein [Algibacter miyuki]MDN3664058.1 HD domain-containing protein [Algibacter miyuki]